MTLKNGVVDHIGGLDDYWNRTNACTGGIGLIFIKESFNCFNLYCSTSTKTCSSHIHASPEYENGKDPSTGKSDELDHGKSPLCSFLNIPISISSCLTQLSRRENFALLYFGSFSWPNFSKDSFFRQKVYTTLHAAPSCNRSNATKKQNLWNRQAICASTVTLYAIWCDQAPNRFVL